MYWDYDNLLLVFDNSYADSDTITVPLDNTYHFAIPAFIQSPPWHHQSCDR